MSEDRIERLELFHVDIPLPTPFYPVWIPGYPEANRRFTLLRVTTHHGLVGHASGLAFDRERDGLGDFVGQFLVGLDPTDAPAAADRLRQASFLGWRNNWMEIAFWDLAAQAKGVLLWALMLERATNKPASEISKPTKGVLKAYASFAEHRPAIVRAESLERAQRMGFLGAKIALRGQDESEDIQQIRSARANVGEQFSLMVHAHQAWSVSLVEDVVRWDLDRALRTIDVASDCGYKWFQEPLHVDEIETQESMRQRAAIPIAGGDIANGHGVLRYLARSEAVSVLTPDISFSGIDAVSRVLGVCQSRKIDLSPSCYGDGLSLMANIHLAAAWQSLNQDERDVWLEYPWEPPAMVPEYRDALLTRAIEIDAQGRLPRPHEPGLGVKIDEKALRRYAKKFYTLTPVRFAVSTARRTGLRQTAAFARAPRRATQSGAKPSSGKDPESGHRI